ncbi:hypothetical protein PInf_003564 [Phytophthora infestans]|nr:hypothetical protein PInf_003564 [Phytophthora infestans]
MPIVKKLSASTVRNNGLVETPYAPDTAADQSIVPQETLNSLRAMQPTLEVTNLPVAAEAVMANGQTKLCDEDVRLDLELTAMTGLVVVRSVPCLVLAGDGDELLLSREVLKGLGIDVEQQLSQLVGSPLLEDEVDEFPVGDELPPSADAVEPINPLDRLLERAVTNGLPAEHVEARLEQVTDGLESRPSVTCSLHFLIFGVPLSVPIHRLTSSHSM